MRKLLALLVLFGGAFAAGQEVVVVAAADMSAALPQLADAAARQFGIVFDRKVLAIEDLSTLRADAENRTEAEQVGVPMRVPEEVRRLMDPSPRSGPASPTHAPDPSRPELG